MHGDAVMERLFGVATVLADLMAEDLAARGLTQARATVLSLVHRGGPSNQRALADTLGVSPRNVTGLVDGLETAGLVVRAAHPGDRRAVLVSLTDAGERVALALAEDQRTLARFLFDGWGPGELDGLTAGLDRLLGRFGDHELGQVRQAALDRWPGG
jgi:DNA-binding MarR family transcriptional regulator